jgi:hypothetical protein
MPHGQIPISPTDNPAIDKLLEHNYELLVDIIEGIAGGTTLKPSDFVPKYVKGRRVESTSRLQSGGNAKDIDEFYTLLQSALQDKQDRDNIVADDRVTLIHEYPPSEIRTELITYRLISRSCATTSQGHPMNKGRSDWKPKLRDVVPDPVHPNKKLLISGQLFDNLIELCCVARTAKVADQRALWLEDLMHQYAWFFTYQGVGQVLYMGRETDSHLEVGGNKLHSRPLRYFVQTEKIFSSSEYTLADLFIRVTAKVE